MRKRLAVLSMVALAFIEHGAADIRDSLAGNSYFSYDSSTLKFYEFKDDAFRGPVDFRERSERYFEEYELVYENRLPFISVDGEARWLVLFSPDFLFLFVDPRSSKARFGIRGRIFAAEQYYRPQRYDASSFLVEGSRQYNASNLGISDLDRPWVEGAPGIGKGETITVYFDRPAERLIISNGFVSFQKPHLYEQNGRVKRIRVYNPSRRIDLEVDISDTPNPQEIALPEETLEIAIEIVEVYEGTKYEDTCINFIYYVPSEDSQYGSENDIEYFRTAFKNKDVEAVLEYVGDSVEKSYVIPHTAAARMATRGEFEKWFTSLDEKTYGEYVSDDGLYLQIVPFEFDFVRIDGRLLLKRISGEKPTPPST